MLAEEVAREIVDAARVKLRLAEMRAEERLVVVPRHKADLLAVDFVRDLQANERAISRISGFDIAPSGVNARRSCGCRRLKRKYD